MEEKVFDEELVKDSEDHERTQEKAEKMVITAQIKRWSGIDSTEKTAIPEEPLTSQENCPLIPQNGKSEMLDICSTKPLSAGASGISADLLSKNLQDIQESCSTSSSNTPISSQATPEKSSSTDTSENADPLYSWNPQYRSSELLSEKDIEALMQSWSVKTKIFRLEEKQNTDIHSKQDSNQNVSSRHSVGALSTPNKRPFVSTSRSANFLSQYALDNEEDPLPPPPPSNSQAKNLNSSHSPPKNLPPNGFSTGK